jgi:hypothetical protein
VVEDSKTAAPLVPLMSNHEIKLDNSKSNVNKRTVATISQDNSFEPEKRTKTENSLPIVTTSSPQIVGGDHTKQTEQNDDKIRLVIDDDIETNKAENVVVVSLPKPSN